MTASTLMLALPKGRMQDALFALLADAGLPVRATARGYRPSLGVPWLDAKILKPQNVIEMLAAGARDVGFAGHDWVSELGAELVEVLDTHLDPVRIVAAAPNELAAAWPPARPLVIASEYAALTRRWVERRDLQATLLRSYGATEVFPPEDADCIVDNAATGATLKANGLAIVDELLTSTTRLYANPRALDDPHKRALVDRLVLLLRSVLEARQRVMLEVNVPAGRLDAVVAALPCMRHPTVSPLHGEEAYAVKAAVPRPSLPALIPELKARGGTDIVISELAQIVP
jgi:ATP phosphoribosyltransferase